MPLGRSQDAGIDNSCPCLAGPQGRLGPQCGILKIPSRRRLPNVSTQPGYVPRYARLSNTTLERAVGTLVSPPCVISRRWLIYGGQIPGQWPAHAKQTRDDGRCTWPSTRLDVHSPAGSVPRPENAQRDCEDNAYARLNTAGYTDLRRNQRDRGGRYRTRQAGPRPRRRRWSKPVSQPGQRIGRGRMCE